MQSASAWPCVLALWIVVVMDADVRAADDPALLAEARISRDAATWIALARVPDGAVASSELEREHGRLIWSFDVTRPDSRNVTEVHVDAQTGKIVSTHTGAPARRPDESVEDEAVQ
jgi:uncharacterized membrane protein YkoI